MAGATGPDDSDPYVTVVKEITFWVLLPLLWTLPILGRIADNILHWTTGQYMFGDRNRKEV
jgi:hypothetical protein